MAGESISGEAQRAAADRTPVVGLLNMVPAFAAAIPAEDRPLAERVLVTPLLSARDEDLAGVLAPPGRERVEVLVLTGVVLKETTLGDRSALELLGTGDVLAPPLNALDQVESRGLSRYVAHGRVSLAALDERFRQAARRWPGLSDVLHDRLGRQTHRASMHMAMLHLPRVEDRVAALFVDLAERFGQVTGDGVVVDVPLTHEVIGRLVGSRRPTVSLALQALASEGVVTRLADGRWNVARAALTP